MARIILTNDDGIEAPGMGALFRASEGLGDRVVVAPCGACSGLGHAVTTHERIVVERLRESWYSVAGTPADCARLALGNLAPDAGWVLSGINRGGNLGADLYISGTVAAAREAALLGSRAIAISQYVRPDLELDWEWTCRISAEVLRNLLARPLSPRSFWNVNLPHLAPGSPDPEVVLCKIDPGPLDVRFRLEGEFNGQPTFAHFTGNYHRRRQDPGRDVEVCFSGKIAVTEVPLEI